MIKDYTNAKELLKNKLISKVRSITINTDVGDIILTQCDEVSISFSSTDYTTSFTKEKILLKDLSKKEANINVEYDNIIFIE